MNNQKQISKTPLFRITKNAAMPYEAPQVEVIEVAVEKGFAGSDVNGTGDDIYIQ